MTARCNFPGCKDDPTASGMCTGHALVRIASAWSPAGEDEGHRKGGEE